MLATVEDLRKGDVVLTTIGSHLVEVKLLRQPCLAKTGKKVTWYGLPRWISIPCVIRYEQFSFTTPYNRNVTSTIPVIANGKEYNTQKRIDFTGRKCWIIKREQ